MGFVVDKVPLEQCSVGVLSLSLCHSTEVPDSRAFICCCRSIDLESISTYVSATTKRQDTVTNCALNVSRKHRDVTPVELR